MPKIYFIFPHSDNVNRNCLMRNVTYYEIMQQPFNISSKNRAF